jgi:glycosyltransferase involved in cell wall biosynthesis
MKIGIYNEQPFHELGGAEYCMAVLAEALAPHHVVEVINHSPNLTVDHYCQFSGRDLAGVRMRAVPIEDYPTEWLNCPWFPRARNRPRASRNLWQRYRDARAWHRGLSEPYDLFVNFVHWMPPFCHARSGVLVVLFPIFRGIGFHMPNWYKPGVRGRLKRAYYKWEWRNRLNSYRRKLAISSYSALWTKRWWDCDCDVVYPPVDTESRTRDKANVILSVGRFTADGPFFKKQKEMALTFQRLQQAGLPGWTYYCVGGLSDRDKDVDYFRDVNQLAGACGARVLANVKRSDLLSLYAQAKIFWHAAGYGAGDDPAVNEHFGIVTVEAMAAGCVPIVIRKGAQPEIVEHGVNGFLWNTLDELKDYTLRVIADEQLRARMSEAARIRARFFSRERFVERFLASVKAILR